MNQYFYHSGGGSQAWSALTGSTPTNWYTDATHNTHTSALPAPGDSVYLTGNIKPNAAATGYSSGSPLALAVFDTHLLTPDLDNGANTITSVLSIQTGGTLLMGTAGVVTGAIRCWYGDASRAANVTFQGLGGYGSMSLAPPAITLPVGVIFTDGTENWGVCGGAANFFKGAMNFGTVGNASKFYDGTSARPGSAIGSGCEFWSKATNYSFTAATYYPDTWPAVSAVLLGTSFQPSTPGSVPGTVNGAVSMPNNGTPSAAENDALVKNGAKYGPANVWTGSYAGGTTVVGGAPVIGGHVLRRG